MLTANLSFEDLGANWDVSDTTIQIGESKIEIFKAGRVRQGGVISAVAVGHRQAALAVMCRG